MLSTYFLGLTLDSLKYLYKGDDVVRDTTMLVVTDLNTVQGRQILAEAISHMVCIVEFYNSINISNEYKLFLVITLGY